MNTIPFRSGERKNRSAAEIFAERCDAGWAPVTVHPLALDAAFCDRAVLTVRGGAVSHKGVRYVHPQLTAGGRRQVAVALPWRRTRAPLFDMGGGRWAYLQPDDLYRSNWTDGALETARRQKAQDQGVRRLSAGVREADVAGVRGARSGMAAAAGRGRGSGALDLGADVGGLAAGAEAATLELLDEVTEAERQRRVRDRQTARLLRSMSDVA